MDHSSVKKQHPRAFRNVNKKINDKDQLLTPFVLYSFRHIFLTRLGDNGCDVWTLVRIAGHSSISVSSRYLHPSPGCHSRLLTAKELYQSSEEDGYIQSR
jgi:site-specific recombinase XerD